MDDPFIFGHFVSIYLVFGALIAGFFLAYWIVVRKFFGERAGATIYPARLTRVAELTHSSSVMGNSTVGGHVTWVRGGQQFHYFERQAGEQSWSVIAVSVRENSLPRFQVRPRRGAVAFPAPPVRCTRPTGVAEFDSRFEIRFPQGVPDELPPLGEAWYQFLLVANLCAPPRPVLEVQQNRCRLYLPGVKRSRKDPSALLDTGCRLLETVLAKYATAAAAPEPELRDVFVSAGEGLPTCPVCSESIAAEPVACAKCATPHHPECWEYTGVCAVYGCMSTERR